MFYSLHLDDEQGLATDCHPWRSVSGVERSTLGQMWVLSVLDDACLPRWSVASMVEWHRVACQVDTQRLRVAVAPQRHGVLHPGISGISEDTHWHVWRTCQALEPLVVLEQQCVVIGLRT